MSRSYLATAFAIGLILNFGVFKSMYTKITYTNRRHQILNQVDGSWEHHWWNFFQRNQMW